MTQLNTNLSSATQQLCSLINTTLTSCSQSNTFDSQTATDIQTYLAQVQAAFDGLATAFNNQTSNIFALVSASQPPYQILALGYLNNTNDIKTVFGALNTTQLFYNGYWKSFKSNWFGTLNLLNGITSNFISSSQNLTNYFNNDIRPYTNSSLTNASLIIDVVNIQVFDCNYIYQNSITTAINNVMIKIVLEILAVSIYYISGSSQDYF
jgi:hypothetical protein